MAFSEEIRDKVWTYYSGNSALEPGPQLPDVGRATTDYRWSELETCYTYGVTVDTVGVTKRSSDTTISYYGTGTTIPQYFQVDTFTHTDGTCAGLKTILWNGNGENELYNATLEGLGTITEQYNIAVSAGRHLESISASIDSNDSDSIALQITSSEYTGGSNANVPCGNYVGGSATILDDGSNENTVSRFSTWTDDTTGKLKGLEVCSILVDRGISWSQYLQWTAEPSSSDFSGGDT